MEIKISTLIDCIIFKAKELGLPLSTIEWPSFEKVKSNTVVLNFRVYAGDCLQFQLHPDRCEVTQLRLEGGDLSFWDVHQNFDAITTTLWRVREFQKWFEFLTQEYKLSRDFFNAHEKQRKDLITFFENKVKQELGPQAEYDFCCLPITAFWLDLSRESFHKGFPNLLDMTLYAEGGPSPDISPAVSITYNTEGIQIIRTDLYTDGGNRHVEHTLQWTMCVPKYPQSLAGMNKFEGPFKDSFSY